MQILFSNLFPLRFWFFNVSYCFTFIEKFSKPFTLFFFSISIVSFKIVKVLIFWNDKEINASLLLLNLMITSLLPIIIITLLFLTIQLVVIGIVHGNELFHLNLKIERKFFSVSSIKNNINVVWEISY